MIAVSIAETAVSPSGPYVHSMDVTFLAASAIFELVGGEMPLPFGYFGHRRGM